MALTISSCGKKETSVEQKQVVSQQDTQTTDVLSEQVKSKISSPTIPTRKSKINASYKKDAEIEKMLQSGKTTWKNPAVLLNPYGNSPLTAYIIFETESAGKVRMTVKGKTKSADITATFEKTKKHRIPVVGLYPGAKNIVQISCVDKTGKEKTKTLTIQTDPLPEALNDAVKVEKKGTPSAYAMTIISGQTTKYPFAYDEAGDIRWYITMTTGSYGVFPLADKRLIYQTDEAETPTEEKPHTTSMYEMDYLGRIYRQYYVKNGIHHEVIEKEPGGNLFVLSSSIAGHTEDVVMEIDRKTGETVKELDMKEIFDKTYRNKVDWAHLNTVSYKEEDHSVLLSPRNLHSAVKVDWNKKKIKWILTNPEMFKGTAQEDKVLKPQGNIKWHFQQHSVYEIPYDLDGDPDTIHVMLYDNHWQTKRKVDFWDDDPNSYVSVYAINEKKMTVRQDKLFNSVKSIITSNCAYDKEKNRMFSFGGYLYPFFEGQKGMIYEYDYKSGAVLNQYSTKQYYYRGYEMAFDWNDLSAKMPEKGDEILGTLQAPKEKKESVAAKKAEKKKVNASFQLYESMLYMTANDHTVSKLEFVGNNKCYQMDYSSAGKGMKEKKNQRYAIAIPLYSLEKDTYNIYVSYEGKWVDVKQSITVK
ncbi:MAG: aryl-sulfate sulfotransferase [Eubacterium sp.]